MEESHASLPEGDPAFRFSTSVSLFISAVVGAVMGLWGALVILDSNHLPAFSRLLLLFVAFVSALMWVSAAIAFRQSRVGVVGAAAFGALSPAIGILPFGFFGLMAIIQSPLVMFGFGLATGLIVHSVACGVAPSAGRRAV